MSAMYRMPKEQFSALLRILETVGGNCPVTDSVYHGLAEVLGTYPKGRVLTPYGEEELVMGVDVGIKWIDDVLHNDISQMGVTVLTGILQGKRYPREQHIREQRKLMEINHQAIQRVVPFYLTSKGLIYYKVIAPDPTLVNSEPPVNMFRVPKEEIVAAAQVLRTVKAVSYFPEWIVAELIGDDGLVIDDVVHESMFGEELKLLE